MITNHPLQIDTENFFLLSLLQQDIGQVYGFTDISRKVTFPGKTFPGKSFSRKNSVSFFIVKQTLSVFCVNWRIILLTGLLSLIREVLQRGPALLIFTLSALSSQVPAHHVGPICSRRVMLSKSDAGSGRWLVRDRRFWQTSCAVPRSSN